MSSFSCASGQSKKGKNTFCKVKQGYVAFNMQIHS
jgi:hypothetical protein